MKRRIDASRTHRGSHLVEWLVLMVLLAAVFVSASTRVREAPPRFSSASVIVETGDSLWSLAAENPVAGLSTAQTAELIAKLNDLETGVLCAGRSVRIPARETVSSVAMR